VTFSLFPQERVGVRGISTFVEISRFLVLLWGFPFTCVIKFSYEHVLSLAGTTAEESKTPAGTHNGG
jgi:hypothetical protein